MKKFTINSIIITPIIIRNLQIDLLPIKNLPKIHNSEIQHLLAIIANMMIYKIETLVIIVRVRELDLKISLFMD